MEHKSNIYTGKKTIHKLQCRNIVFCSSFGAEFHCLFDFIDVKRKLLLKWHIMCWLLTLFPFVCFVINNSIEANQIDFSLFQFQNRCISWEKKIKITQVRKKVRLGTNLARNSYILYIINHWMLCLLFDCVCCTSEGQSIFWFTFTHLNYASFLLKMIFFIE